MTLVIIPARMGSERLPGKPRALIGRKKLIEHCVDRANEADIEPIVATDDEYLMDFLRSNGISCVLTGQHHHSGTDRVAEAAEILDPEGRHKYVINYQGDMPFIDPRCLSSFFHFVEGGAISGTQAFTAVCDLKLVHLEMPCIFNRQVCSSHIGLYGYSRQALRTFAATPQSELELRYKLEQLRCPEKFRWALMYFNQMPMEINTPQDLEEANRLCKLLR